MKNHLSKHITLTKGKQDVDNKAVKNFNLTKHTQNNYEVERRKNPQKFKTPTKSKKGTREIDYSGHIGPLFQLSVVVKVCWRS